MLVRLQTWRGSVDRDPHPDALQRVGDLEIPVVLVPCGTPAPDSRDESLLNSLMKTAGVAGFCDIQEVPVPVWAGFKNI